MLEHDEVVGFLDVRPLFPGHTLVVPVTHYETFAELPSTEVGRFFEHVKAVEQAVVKAVGAAGSFVAMNNRVSQSVPHLHIHVVPRNPKDGLRGFFWPRGRYDSDFEMESVAASIRAHL